MRVRVGIRMRIRGGIGALSRAGSARGGARGPALEVLLVLMLRGGGCPLVVVLAGFSVLRL